MILKKRPIIAAAYWLKTNVDFARSNLAFVLLAASLSIGLLVGCGSSDSPSESPLLVPAKGFLSSGQEPMAGVIVLFVPKIDGIRARGISNPTGQFPIVSSGKRPGIAPGDYTVLLKQLKLDPRETAQDTTLARFGDINRSPIRITVKEHTKQIEIDLEEYQESER